MKTIILIFAMFLVSDVSFADDPARHDARQGLQRARIRDGVQDGSLTRPEAARLRAGQRHVRQAEKKAEADGIVTPEETAKLEKMQDRQSKRIYRQKHDGQNKGDASAPAAAVPAN